MNPEIVNLTGESAEFYITLCSSIVDQFTELENFYSVIYCFLVTNSSETDYQQRLRELHFPVMSIPSNAAYAFSSDGRGAITIRVDLLENEDSDFQDFVLSEECCHLIEQEGNSNPTSTPFEEFNRRYGNRNSNFRKAVRRLNTLFNHFKVNQLLIENDFEQWIRYKGNYYGSSMRDGCSVFLSSIAGLNEKERIAILNVNLLEVVSFFHVIQLTDSNQASSERQETLNQMGESLEETILLIEEHARDIDPDFPPILEMFTANVFQNEETFWNTILHLWDQLEI